MDDIRRKCSKVLDQYDVNFCYLFGPYAKGKETPASDVDLNVVYETLKNDIPELLELLEE